MAVTDWGRLTAITQSYVIPQVVHQLKKELPLLGRLLAKVKKRSSGGVRIEQPVAYAFNASGGWYSGLEVLNTNQETTRTRAYFDWKSIFQPIVINNMEAFKNGVKMNNKEQVVDLLKQEMEEAKESLKNNLATALYADGTGATIGGVANGAMNGLKNSIDDGTEVTSFGDINYSSYSWWQAQVETSVGGLTLSHLATQYSAASSGNGRESVNLIETTETLFNAYEALHQPNIRWNNPTPGSTINPSGMKLMFRGAEVEADEYCPSGYMFGLNLNYFELFAGDHPVHPTDKNGFTVTPMREPTDQDGQVGFILAYLQLVNSRPARSFKSTGLTA